MKQEPKMRYETGIPLRPASIEEAGFFYSQADLAGRVSYADGTTQAFTDPRQYAQGPTSCLFAGNVFGQKKSDERGKAGKGVRHQRHGPAEADQSAPPGASPHLQRSVRLLLRCHRKRGLRDDLPPLWECQRHHGRHPWTGVFPGPLRCGERWEPSLGLSFPGWAERRS